MFSNLNTNFWHWIYWIFRRNILSDCPEQMCAHQSYAVCAPNVQLHLMNFVAQLTLIKGSHRH